MLIELHACLPQANRHRHWRVETGMDLFGLWTARVTFGRIGRTGRTICYEFASEAELNAFLQKPGFAVARQPSAGLESRIASCSPPKKQSLCCAWLD